MGTDEFPEGCEGIEGSLYNLVSDLYRTVDEGVSGEERNELVVRSKRKIKQYVSKAFQEYEAENAEPG